MTSPHDTYTSPLASRNASPEMLRIWSPRHKFTTWRRIWLAVAEAQQACGLDISDEQIAQMRAHVEVTDEDMERAARYEHDLRHDVMAHVHAFGDAAPAAKAIIHLGCTSQDVVCNADAQIIEEAGLQIMLKLVRVIGSLSAEAARNSRIPALGFTHYQPAQPVTVGRRIANWASDLHEVYVHFYVTHYEYIPRRGLRGATGTQASFLQLFNGDSGRVDEFERHFFNNMPPRGYGNFVRTYPITGQTYPRLSDALILADLASIAAVLHKIATDIRLLSNRKELDEPFGDKQIGSSAMPYKRNPMKCERICGLSRFVMNLVGNAYDTAATQWLERTLDDSSNRRLSLPEAFLALDGALDLMHQVASGLVVHEAMVKRNLMAELPFLATENILMECVKAGADRQEYHEKIRVHAQAAGMRVKQEGLDNDLLERLKNDPAFHAPALKRELDWDGLMDPMKYVGRAVEQTERFLKEVVEPLRERYADELDSLGDSDRGV
ncbi:MAG: adenylosuccinate lyase [Phycisphaerales bacterium]